MKNLFNSMILISVFVIAFGSNELLAQQKQIALTIDDLPINGPQFDAARMQKMTDKMLTVIKENKIPTVGFVNESLLYAPNQTDERIAVLKSWTDAGVELGNHTFSHLGFKDATLQAYQDDFIRGEAVTKMLMKERNIRYFRHPYLQMGKTFEEEKAFEDFIAKRGYKIAPVTIDSLDWMFLYAYLKATNGSDEGLRKNVSSEYLKYVGKRFDFSEDVSQEIFGRPVKHILMLHANEINADNFAELIKLINDKGYEFISLEEALSDPIYKFPEKYSPHSDWLSLWTFSKGVQFNPPAAPEFVQKIFNDHNNK